MFNRSGTILVSYPPGNPATAYTVPGGVTTIQDYAFEDVGLLQNITIPQTVKYIGYNSFFYCLDLGGVYFQGDAPGADPSAFMDDHSTAFYYAGTAGWGTSIGGIPTSPLRLPYPVILTTGSSFGVQSNQFGFVISWDYVPVTLGHHPVVIEACQDMSSPVWQPIETNYINATNGWLYFSDPQWSNYSSRFYRVREE